MCRSVVGYKQFLDVTLLKSIADVLRDREMGWTSGGRIEPPAREKLVYDPGTRWPAFELFESDGSWSWQLHGRNGRAIGTFGSKEKAERTVDVLRKESRTQPELLWRTEGGSMRGFRVTTTDEGDWCWQLLDHDGSALAESVRSYSTRWEAKRALEAACQRAVSATVRIVESTQQRTEDIAVPEV